MSMIKTINYKTDSGKEPLTEWLDDLDFMDRSIVNARIARLRLGNFQSCKPVTGSKSGICEIVIDHGPGYRVYYGRKSLVIVILLVGGTKRTQRRDIVKAEQYWQAYQKE
jgi:putative addiction module killer protein